MASDLMLMVRNSKEFFGDGTDVYQIATELEKFIIECFGDKDNNAGLNLAASVSVGSLATNSNGN